jgi:hypothetical protein
MLREAGLKVEERPVSMDEVAASYDEGNLRRYLEPELQPPYHLLKN